MCYIGHIEPNPRQPSWPRWVPVKPNVEQGRGSFRAQAVSQKTRKTSASKTKKKAAPASRSASKGRAKASVKDAKKAAAEDPFNAIDRLTRSS